MTVPVDTGNARDGAERYLERALGRRHAIMRCWAGHQMAALRHVYTTQVYTEIQLAGRLSPG